MKKSASITLHSASRDRQADYQLCADSGALASTLRCLSRQIHAEGEDFKFDILSLGKHPIVTAVVVMSARVQFFTAVDVTLYNLQS